MYNGTRDGTTNEISGMDNHYGMNMINQKMMFPRNDNFSDDLLNPKNKLVYIYTQNTTVKQEIFES